MHKIISKQGRQVVQSERSKENQKKLDGLVTEEKSITSLYFHHYQRLKVYFLTEKKKDLKSSKTRNTNRQHRMTTGK